VQELTNQIAARTVAGLSILVAAALPAAAITYVYVGQFQHPRYWGGTIRKVETTEISLVRELLTRPRTPPLPDTQDEAAPLFEALNKRLAVELRRGDRLVYDNRESGWPTLGDPKPIVLADGATLLVHRTAPPEWSGEFSRWLRNPDRWLTDQFNRTTAPFVSFLIIFLVSLVALAWRHRARHLSQEVLALLRQPTEPRP
jgi:hypothetical protein